MTKIKQKLFINTLVRGRFLKIGLNFVKQCYFAIQMTFISADSKLSFSFHVINMNRLQENSIKLN